MGSGLQIAVVRVSGAFLPDRCVIHVLDTPTDRLKVVNMQHKSSRTQDRPLWDASVGGGQLRECCS